MIVNPVSMRMENERIKELALNEDITVREWLQENQQLNPDIQVQNTPKSLVEGRDLQIEAAVKHLLEEIAK